jgi:hypothetical protein
MHGEVRHPPALGTALPDCAPEGTAPRRSGKCKPITETLHEEWGFSMRNWYWLILMWFFGCLCIPGYVSAQTADMAELVPGEIPDGWIARGEPQRFAKESLFEHINGQADLFLQYGFERSIFRVFENKNAKQEKIDLDIYDMGDVVHAFGIFSRFRQEDHPAGIGLDSYADDRYAIFYKGKYFIVLQATESSSSALKQLAKIVESRIADSSPRPKELGYFPKSGLKPGSIEYYPQGLMGHEFLKRGFKATYVMNDKPEATSDDEVDSPDSCLFVAIFDNTGEAARALKNFKGVFAKNESGQAGHSNQPRFDMVRVEDAYQGTLIVVHKGHYLAGATGFGKEKDAEKLLAELIVHIE